MKQLLFSAWLMLMLSCKSSEPKAVDVNIEDERIALVKKYVSSVTGSSDVKILNAGPFEKVVDTNDLKECFLEKYVPTVIDFDNPPKPQIAPIASEIKETFWFSIISVAYKNKFGGDSKLLQAYFLDDSSKVIFAR